MSLRLMGQLPLRISSLGRSSHLSGDKVPAVKYWGWNVLHNGTVVVQGPWQTSSWLARNQDSTCEQYKCSCNTYFSMKCYWSLSLLIFLSLDKHQQTQTWRQVRSTFPSSSFYCRNHTEKCSHSLPGCRFEIGFVKRKALVWSICFISNPWGNCCRVRAPAFCAIPTLQF